MAQEDESGTANHISGAVFGPAVQAGSIDGGVHFHFTNGIPDAEPAGTPEPPLGWSDLPALSAEVRALLRAQIQVAHELPYRLPGARRPSLATVYVRQDLGSGAEEPALDQPRPMPILDDRGQVVDPPNRPVVRLAVRPPSRTVRAALDADDHVVVTGGPGQGKSTLSLRLAADVAERWLVSGAEATPLAEPVVPLRLTARELATRLDLPFPDAVAGSAQVEYGALLPTPVTARAVGGRVGGCRWLLLVDGLDEVADGTERDRLVTVLSWWASEAGSPYRVLLTTRPIEGAALAPLQRIKAARYELQPFDEEALRHFADNWFDDSADAYRFVRQIRAAHLDELVRVPLLATIAAIIFEQRGDRPLPDNQYELYEAYLKYLRCAHPVPATRFEPVHEPLLEHLGRIRLEADTSLTAAACDWVARHLPDLHGDWQEELAAYLTAVGPFIRRAGDVRFLHHSFAEHLAATATARELPEHFQPEHVEFGRLLHASRPRERGRHARAVLLHYTRLRVAEADRLVEWLHGGSADEHLLAARLLALHVPAGQPAVDAFLTVVRAWAMTTQYSGREILEQASRATHHPGLPEWLATLMRDQDAPWPSRVEAAAALSTRLQCAESAEAVALLRAVVDDADVPVSHRLAAAEALADCRGAEREAAERGLRSVLAAPSATAVDCRTAAVVLAGFGDTARVCAVDALTRMLDDSWTPDADLVEAATGLVEIGVEFHERCAKVFRTILNSRTRGTKLLSDAATGLASLGAHHLGEAVAALSRLARDQRLDHMYRIGTASALADLGPQHRTAAAEHLLAIAAEPNLDPSTRWQLAEALAKRGSQRQALDLLRSVLVDIGAIPNNKLWAAANLADLGPEYQDEAANALRRVSANPLASAYDRAAALARLATLSEPHRSWAVTSLQRILADRGADPRLRCQAATELIRLGPQFHHEVTNHLLEIASYQVDPDIRLRAWRIVRDLGSRLRDRASTALLALIDPGETECWKSHRRRPVLYRACFDDEDAMARTLAAVVDDPHAGRVRIDAIHELIDLGPRFHAMALTGVVELLRSQALPDDDFWLATLPFTNFGSAPRAELAGAFRAKIRHPNASAELVCKVVMALEELDYRTDPEVIAALRNVVADAHTDLAWRAEAAVALARSTPEALGEAVDLVLSRNQGASVSRWVWQVRRLAAVGADVTHGLREAASNADIDRLVRENAADTLARQCPDLREEALSELHAQADDEFLKFQSRTNVIFTLAELDSEALKKAMAYHHTVLNQESHPVSDRCQSAYQLARLDESFGEITVAALRRFATGPEFTAEEHAHGVEWLDRLTHFEMSELAQLALAVARDPAATATVRRQLNAHMRGRGQIEVERSLLADHTASLEDRVGSVNEWDHGALAEEAQAVIREVLNAVETTPAERVQAAAALARLSPRHVPEAVRLLEELSADQRIAGKARIELANLSPTWRRRIILDAERIVADEACSWRHRNKAALLIRNLMSDLPVPVIRRLRQAVEDQRVSDNHRVTMLYALRTVDGLGRLRELLDDERTPPATRRAAANRLKSHATDDRATGAHVLHTIATDNACRPALRWRAAKDLTSFGARGRELGVAALQAIVADEGMPIGTRVGAATALAEARPDLRGETLQLLRRLEPVGKPLQRLQVLKAVGALDAAEGAQRLHAMTSERTLRPGIRLRAAEAMGALHRDYRDKAALMARETMHDETAPWHVRIKAARALARWSELCRPEAQALLTELAAR